MKNREMISHIDKNELVPFNYALLLIWKGS